MSNREFTIEVSQRRVISRSEGIYGRHRGHYFPTALFRLQDGGLLLGYSVGRDEIPGNLATGIGHALLKSLDEGANWFLLTVIRERLYNEAFPICVLPDDRLLGMSGSGTLMDKARNPYCHGYTSSDSARSWDGPSIVPLRFSPEMRLPEPTSTPGRMRASFSFQGNILTQDDGALLRNGDGMFAGDQYTRVILMRSTDDGQSWTYVSTVADPRNNPRNFNESALLEVDGGELISVMRTDLDGPNPMYQARSTDGGYSWTPAKPVGVNGVRPQMVKMSNGIIACSYGRLGGPSSRGVQIMFSRDGGEIWTQHTTIYEEASTGYTALLEVSPNELILAYDELAHGERCLNSINMVRIAVSA